MNTSWPFCPPEPGLWACSTAAPCPAAESGQREVVGVRAAQRTVPDRRQDQHDQPCADHPPRVAGAPPAATGQPATGPAAAPGSAERPAGNGASGAGRPVRGGADSVAAHHGPGAGLDPHRSGGRHRGPPRPQDDHRVLRGEADPEAQQHVIQRGPGPGTGSQHPGPDPDPDGDQPQRDGQRAALAPQLAVPLEDPHRRGADHARDDGEPQVDREPGRIGGRQMARPGGVGERQEAEHRQGSGHDHIGPAEEGPGQHLADHDPDEDNRGDDDLAGAK